MAFKLEYVVVIMIISVLTLSPVEARIFLKTEGEDTRLTSNGRRLMIQIEKFTSSKATALLQGSIAPGEKQDGSSGLVAGSEDVRPTNPGHSPGVGH